MAPIKLKFWRPLSCVLDICCDHVQIQMENVTFHSHDDDEINITYTNIKRSGIYEIIIVSYCYLGMFM